MGCRGRSCIPGGLQWPPLWLRWRSGTDGMSGSCWAPPGLSKCLQVTPGHTCCCDPGWPAGACLEGCADPGFTSLSLHRVFKKASPNGKVSRAGCTQLLPEPRLWGPFLGRGATLSLWKHIPPGDRADMASCQGDTALSSGALNPNREGPFQETFCLDLREPRLWLDLPASPREASRGCHSSGKRGSWCHLVISGPVPFSPQTPSSMLLSSRPSRYNH